METSSAAGSNGQTDPSFSAIDKLKVEVEDFLRENEVTEAAKVIEGFFRASSDPIDDKSQGWLKSATLLIADLEKSVPEAISELNDDILRDIKVENLAGAQEKAEQICEFSESRRDFR